MTESRAPGAPGSGQRRPAEATGGVPRQQVIVHLLVAAGCVAGVVLGMLALEPPGIPERSEAIGPFELITHTAGQAGRPSLQRFSLRHRGSPFTIEGKAGMYGDRSATYDLFNSAITFESNEPVVVVNVGDPINGGFFYLVREHGGRPVAEFMGPSHGGVSAEFLDAAPHGPRERPRDLTVKRARLGAGRWLLLGDSCVLDTQAMTAHALPAPEGASPNQSAPPLALSPDQRSLVRFGYEDYPSTKPRLIVSDFVAGASYTLPVDAKATRFARWEDLDRAWVEHYFEWTRDDQGRDRLAPRPGAEPLPYRGTLTVDGSGYREYRLSPVSPGMARVVSDFLVTGLGARVEAGGPDAGRTELKIADALVHVSASGQDVSVYVPHGGGRTKVIAEIAARFDAELATGRHDALFDAASAGDEP